MIKFKEVAEKIHKSGVSKTLTVRELLELFGQLRRGRKVARQVKSALWRARLETVPSFQVVHIDSVITLQPRPTAARKGKKETSEDPIDASIAIEEREVVLTIGQLEKANLRPFRVTRNDTVTKAITLMMQHDTAYLAVMSGDRTVDGILTWQTIGRAGAAKRPANTVDQYMRTAVRIVEIDTPLFDAVREIVEGEVVLVRAKDRTICGLVSAQDIATQFVTLSEPFLFLEQIENHLRAILEKARLSAGAIKGLVNPNDTDRLEKVNGIDDLSFGETARAFAREDIWNRLHLLLDRAAFCQRLEELRSIRNKVMHFHPDGISPEDREVLRKTRQMLQGL